MGPMLPGWFRSCGAVIRGVAHLPDSAAVIRAMIEGSDADIVVTTGGTSRGATDHLRPALRNMGASMLVDGVAVRPGHPMLMARTPTGRLVVGLPGNPLAALAGVVTLVEAVLRAMIVDLNLPPDLSDEDLDSLWGCLLHRVRRPRHSIVTGHTARYAGCAWPMMEGATCIALGPQDGYITPSMARPGDRVLVTKGAAIGATALFAAAYGDRLTDPVGTPVVAAALELLGAMTVVPEARVAAACGVHDQGVTAMHDATEGGVLGGLLEIAEASDVGMVIERAVIPVRPQVRAVCDAAGMDPYAAISEGTLLLTVRPAPRCARPCCPARGRDRRRRDRRGGPRSHRAVPRGRRQIRTPDTPGVDPFWAAYAAWAPA